MRLAEELVAYTATVSLMTVALERVRPVVWGKGSVTLGISSGTGEGVCCTTRLDRFAGVRGLASFFSGAGAAGVVAAGVLRKKPPDEKMSGRVLSTITKAVIEQRLSTTKYLAT
jgi:hypothetical protein